jgi:hypothetical protein
MMTDPEIDRLLSTDVLAAIETKIASQQDAGDEETRAFYIQDVSQIDKTYCQWTRELPSVSAFYGTIPLSFHSPPLTAFHSREMQSRSWVTQATGSKWCRIRLCFAR